MKLLRIEQNKVYIDVAKNYAPRNYEYEEALMQKYKEAQDLLTLDAPSVYIFNTPHRVATWDYITGYTYVGLLGYDMAWWYLGLDKDLREMWSGGANMAEAELNWMQALVIVPTGHKQK